MKILILEDRPSRQRILLPNKARDVEVLKTLQGVFMPESGECKRIISLVNKEAYLVDDDVRLIIIHRSALDTRGLHFLNVICNKRKIKLICFGGGVSQQIYNTDGSEYLNINSSDFYNVQLIPFLEKFNTNENTNLLEVTNINWQLTYLFLARQINHSLQQEEDDDRKILFQNKLEQIQDVLKLDDIKNVEKINNEINKKIISI